jgi:hypothetical protein
LREILVDLAAGRNVSARVSLPLQIGFFNGQTALYITPEVGVDPSAGTGIVAAAQQIAVSMNSNRCSMQRTSHAAVSTCSSPAAM